MDYDFEDSLLRRVLEYYFFVESEQGWGWRHIISNFLILVAQVHATQKLDVEGNCIDEQMQLGDNKLLWNILHFVNNNNA